jgi:pyruvate/2-oxoacid:ferredoxin oxidoreductase alpha subunit
VDLAEYRDVPVGCRPGVPALKPVPGVNALTGQPDPRLRPEESYLPYELDPLDGVPPFSPLGGPHITRFTTSSHDEHGFLTKDAKQVARLNDHLSLKIEDHRHEMEYGLLGRQQGADTLFISYGITAQAMRESVARCREIGRPASGLTLHTLWPVPEDLILQAAEGHRRLVVAELNHGQYVREVERLLYRQAALHRLEPPDIVSLTRVDGNLITPEQFLDEHVER